MTALATRTAARVDLPVVLVLSVAALALRDVGTFSFLVPAACALGVLAVQGRSAARSDAAAWLAFTAVGACAFALVRFAMPGTGVRTTAFATSASVVAAIAEEIVFRRGLYGWLERWGAALAIAVTAIAFGLVHAPMYGWAVVPLDIGAGLVLGWQRWASRTWTSPATSHALANVLGSI